MEKRRQEVSLFKSRGATIVVRGYNTLRTQGFKRAGLPPCVIAVCNKVVEID